MINVDFSPPKAAFPDYTFFIRCFPALFVYHFLHFVLRVQFYYIFWLLKINNTKFYLAEAK